ncbi:MAG: thiamine-phosphate kinase [Omnitrophica bacterium RIFCSPLOWO2_12_FULL_50_11]|nr:MAG: thiamine-phosphate kinase [Omnitrophica bacterium RIFCSPLOWO2_12_FULL_50_11]
MRIESIGEFGLIRLIQGWLNQHILDDTAVLPAPSGRNQLLTIDTLVEGVDFLRGRATPEQLGWKALAVSLSDIAAMGGKPEAAVISLTLPRRTPVRFVRKFYDGLQKLARRFQVALVGGDLSRGSKLSCSVAVLGEAGRKRTIFRTGAKVGDFICVTGRLGGSILGRHLTFMPRIKEGQFLARGGVHSMIDVSDGLVQDLNHLLSQGKLAYALDETQIPVTPAARKLARGNFKKTLAHALTDGEDFELLFTISPRQFRKLQPLWKRRFRTPVSVIGRVIRRPKGWKAPQGRCGFRHF